MRGALGFSGRGPTRNADRSPRSISCVVIVAVLTKVSMLRVAGERLGAAPVSAVTQFSSGLVRWVPASRGLSARGRRFGIVVYQYTVACDRDHPAQTAVTRSTSRRYAMSQADHNAGATPSGPDRTPP